MKKEEILQAFQFRHACKEFDINKKVSDNDFQLILESARLSPSSFGFEPWHFVVVQNSKLREKLATVAWGAEDQLVGASHFIIGLSFQAHVVKYDSEYIRNFMANVQQLPEEIIDLKGEYYKNFQLTDFDLNNERSLFDWASKQCYIALGNMMTVAALMNIDSCPIEGFNKTMTEELLKKETNIDFNKYGLSYMVAFGYRTEEPRPKTRRPISEVVSWKL